MTAATRLAVQTSPMKPKASAPRASRLGSCASWSAVNSGFRFPTTVNAIAADSRVPQRLYASVGGSIYRSDDIGQTWKRFDHGVKAEATMMAVTVHPRDPNQVYGVSRFGQVFGTQDGGRSWNESRLPEGVRDAYAVACG